MPLGDVDYLARLLALSGVFRTSHRALSQDQVLEDTNGAYQLSATDVQDTVGIHSSGAVSLNNTGVQCLEDEI